MIDTKFWKNKKILITGHTGFKGSWLSVLLSSFGAKVTGYALPPPTNPSMFEICSVANRIDSRIADVRDLKKLHDVMNDVKPEIVIHMAAQPLVRESYLIPVETYEINVMGTVNVLEAARFCSSIKVIVNVTTDKCYENKEWIWAYRENDPLGGYDPYSNSKACSEFVTAAYRSSYFNPDQFAKHGVSISSVRAGNVIGGGDWASDRLIPDIIRSLIDKKQVAIRNPNAIRPWQHVLEPLSGYLELAENMYKKGIEYSGAWNFGPDETNIKNVEWIVAFICSKWGNNASYAIDNNSKFHEAQLLKLDNSKAKNLLKWNTCWDIETALDKTIEWTKAYVEEKDLMKLSLHQINEYFKQKEDL